MDLDDKAAPAGKADPAAEDAPQGAAPEPKTAPGAETRSGVVLGVLLGFDGDAPLVAWPAANPSGACVARALTRLGSGDIGETVALLFEDGDAARPIVIGRLMEAPPAAGAAPPEPPDPFGIADRAVPDPTPEPAEAQSVVSADGTEQVITATERLELRVGQARFVMEANGRITMRGTYIVSHAARTNRIRGGSVNLN